MSEEEKSKILEMHKQAIRESMNGEYSEVVTTSTPQGGVDPSWLKNASSIVGMQLTPFNQGAVLVSSVTAMAKNSGEPKTIIVPKGTTFKLTPSRNFMVAKAYQINPKEGVFDLIRALKDNQYIASMLKSGQLNATPIDIAVVKGAGGLLYPNGMDMLSLANQSSRPLMNQIMAL